MDDLLNEILPIIGEATIQLLLWGAVFSFFFGLLALLLPGKAIAINNAMSHWYSARRSTKFLELPRYHERWIYRYHRPVGILLLAGCLFILYQLRFNYGLPELQRLVAQNTSNTVVTEIIIDSAYGFLLIGTVFSLIISGIIIFRPSLLKDFEAWSNRWISTRRALRFASQRYDSTENIFRRRPRLIGGIIILGSLYTVLILVSVL